MYGFLLFSFGIFVYLLGVSLSIPRMLFGMNGWLLSLNEIIVWYSGIPIMLGVMFAMVDILLMSGQKRKLGGLRSVPVVNSGITVVLTAYNDEDSISEAVTDFLGHNHVRRVIVVSNNSSDRTRERAEAAGATVFDELLPGYGRCVHRCLTEAIKLTDVDLVVLCEGDRTFRADDIDKLLPYIQHADIVNGTRTVERLRQHHTQLTTFMYYGNFFVGKLLEAKHLGAGTFTDVGTTYKICRANTLRDLLPYLDSRINLEFNAYFLDTAVSRGCIVVEAPITFHPRVGISKGGNTNNLRALKVGLRMIIGLVFGWRHLRS